MKTEHEQIQMFHLDAVLNNKKHSLGSTALFFVKS